ncbi:tyrosine-type recombinase/integrase [Aurantiacibacter sp. MUD61]|uniref:tyrosine-type recombinase/integrase n=1 Tax=Aurantiacibacter sp. MUD61 TaxID=3009083 RepID=UPI0022F0D624|nr:tyrosine-type recombinase/integrase [Aurantiacibacter sp. MUD61]
MTLQVITPANRRNLAPGQRLTEYGITVEKLVDGDEKWSLAFIYLRKRVKRVLGLKSENWNATRALEVRDQIRADIRDGLDTLPRGRQTPLRFAELAAWYLDEIEASGGKNLERKRLHLERRLVPKLGHLVLETISEEHIGRYCQEMVQSGLSPSTVNRDLATLSHVWNMGVRRRKLRRTPCSIVKLAEPEGRTVVLSDHECDLLIEAAKRDSHPLLWLFVEFGLGTAMRSAEIVSARFDHIDWKNCRLYLPKAKAGDRTQPLTKSLVELLRRERERRTDRNGWIFPSTRTATGHVNEFNGAFKRAVRAAGLSPEMVTPHTMRHTAATKLVASGAPLPAVQRVTGHKTFAMVLRYTHLADRSIDEAMVALERSVSA